MKYINNRDKFLSIKSNIITESIDNSGPFANDIPWNDSLIGRLINSVIRKAKIGVNLNQMKKVEQQLRDTLTEMIAISALEKSPESDKKEYVKIFTYSFIDALDKAIENGDDLSIIKDLNNNTINEIKSFENFDKKDELVSKLEDFNKFLNNLDEIKPEERGVNYNEEFYKSTMGLLKSVIDLCDGRKRLIKNITSNPINDPTTATNAVVTDDKEKEDDVVVNDSYIFEDISNIAIDKVYKALDITKVMELYPKIKELYNKSLNKDELSKKWVISVGEQIIKNEATNGTNKKTLTELLKESTIYNDIPKAISLLSNYILPFSENLEMANEEIKGFINNYNNIKKLYPKLNISENKLLSYNNFIFENEDNDNNIIQKIRAYWKEHINVENFVVDISEAKKIEKNLDKISDENDKEGIVISGIDPIINIVKLFNRAYKLHTTQVIPTGRSGGRVSNKTFREYTSFGGGTPQDAGFRGGPYRNNKLFDSWENTVLNIIRETKYQKIFRGETIIKTESGVVIRDAGKNLSKFMIDMLNGEYLYKDNNGKGGAQAELIYKYFNIKIDAAQMAIGGISELNSNAKNASGIKTKKVIFTKEPIIFDTNKSLENTFFAATVFKDSKKMQYYFNIQSIDNTYAYVSYSTTMYFYEKYIEAAKINTEKGIEQGNLPMNIYRYKDIDGKECIIKATRIKIDNLIDKSGDFKLKGMKEFEYLYKYNDGKNIPNSKSIKSEKIDKLDFENCYTLAEVSKNDKDDDIFIRLKISNNQEVNKTVMKVGGFTDISKSENINDIKA